MPLDPTFLLITLSALAGAAHVLAPDHWVPLSILSWQRGWSLLRLIGFSLLAYGTHVLLGAALYFVIAPFSRDLHPQHLFILAIALMLAATSLRGLRYNRMREVFGSGPKSVWSLLAAVSILGPAEALIPIFAKSFQMGAGYLLPLMSFLGGTLVAALIAILWGKQAWDSPVWIPRGIRWVNQRSSAVPFLLASTLGIAILVQISS